MITDSDDAFLVVNIANHYTLCYITLALNYQKTLLTLL